ncbi:ABC transporter ATP-binding protein [Pelagibacterium sediminicola]|uniref:ABC transporter ATP-binding protein n=1 Tax=Pelagibacterium sediminicola TaxID=2248761 RepID=UPI000E31C5E4|nr:ABC transporter ATP-binding protein [Pelagibacterium sediminicola]
MDASNPPPAQEPLARDDRASGSDGAVLTVNDLRVCFAGDRTTTTAVDGVSFTLRKGRSLGVVGESGSGKSVSSLAVLRLLPTDSAQISGEILFAGQDLLSIGEKQMRNLRGNQISMIFQEPMTSLNPSYTVGDQVAETILRHRSVSKAEAWTQAVEMLRLVRIPSPETRARQYPHNLSGGMRQRVMIAMALACEPQVLIADEPTTALDVTIQAQILDLLENLKSTTGTAIVLITHDLGVVAEACDDVIVMYAGQVVESGSVEQIFSFPQHPYTVGLLGSLPRLDEERDELVAIGGTVPDMTQPPAGCRFAARCPFRIEKCAETPPMLEVNPGHTSRCWRTPLEELADEF